MRKKDCLPYLQFYFYLLRYVVCFVFFSCQKTKHNSVDAVHSTGEAALHLTEESRIQSGPKETTDKFSLSSTYLHIDPKSFLTEKPSIVRFSFAPIKKMKQIFYLLSIGTNGRADHIEIKICQKNKETFCKEMSSPFSQILLKEELTLGNLIQIRACNQHHCSEWKEKIYEIELEDLQDPSSLLLAQILNKKQQIHLDLKQDSVKLFDELKSLKEKAAHSCPDATKDLDYVFNFLTPELIHAAMIYKSESGSYQIYDINEDYRRFLSENNKLYLPTVYYKKAYLSNQKVRFDDSSPFIMQMALLIQNADYSHISSMIHINASILDDLIASWMRQNYEKNIACKDFEKEKNLIKQVYTDALQSSKNKITALNEELFNQSH